MESKQKKRSLFNLLYRTNRDGKGVEKETVGPPTLNNFFKLLGRNIGNIAKINLLMVFGNFPLFFGLYALTGYLNHTSPAQASQLFSPLFGALTASPEKIDPVTTILFGVHGVQAEASVMSIATYVFFGLTALVLFTFGFVNVGTSYLLRNIVRGEPIFFWQDFFYAIRRNLRQSFVYGIIDCLIMLLFFYNITLAYFNLGNMVSSLVFFGNLLLIFLYFMMRFYIYILMLTFDLSLFKLFKNSFIFALLGFKRNALAVTGIALAMAINFIVLVYFQPLGVLIPLTFLFGLCAFMGAYAAYPKIKQLMIDPYYKSDRPDAERIEPEPQAEA